MDFTLPITVIFIAIFAILQFGMGVTVGLTRVKTGIMFLDGGDETLMRRMRAHGNFTENVPLALLIMAAAELIGTASAVVVIGGFLLLAGRLFHYAALTTIGPDFGRALGAGLTSLSMLMFAVVIIVKASGMF